MGAEKKGSENERKGVEVRLPVPPGRREEKGMRNPTPGSGELGLNKNKNKRSWVEGSEGVWGEKAFDDKEGKESSEKSGRRGILRRICV